MTDMTPLARAARSIAGLYNNATPMGIGAYIEGATGSGKMPPEVALAMARAGRDRTERRFPGHAVMDYVKGRVVKVNLCIATGEPEFTGAYDRDNGGEGACLKAIAAGLADPFYAELDTVTE